jgi:hypothetical protein
MKKLVVLFLAGVIWWGLGGRAGADDLFKPWLDWWNNGAYCSTNFERNSFATYILRSEGRVGVNLLRVWGDTYLAPYVVYSTAYSQDSNYWNNNLYSGFGIRIKPFAKNDASSLVGDLKVFYETMSASYYKDAASARAAGLPERDTVFGLDLYYEWNQPRYCGDKKFNFDGPWSEIWTNLSFRQTDFYQDNFNSYIFRAQPKWGVFTGAREGVPPRFEPYLAGDLVMSGRNYSWLNRLSYGIGVRMQPFRYLTNETAAWMFKFKMFLELWGVSYLKEQPATQISTDVRFGIDFSVGR